MPVVARAKFDHQGLIEHVVLDLGANQLGRWLVVTRADLVRSLLAEDMYSPTGIRIAVCPLVAPAPVSRRLAASIDAYYVRVDPPPHCMAAEAVDQLPPDIELL